MNEAAWCYLEGFGCKKDKVSDSRLVCEESQHDFAPGLSIPLLQSYGHRLWLLTFKCGWMTIAHLGSNEALRTSF